MPLPTNENTAYQKLLKALRKELTVSLNRVERYVDQQRIKSYWKIGRCIADSLLDEEFKSAFGSNLFGRLADDLNMNERLLHYIVRFYRFYPTLPERSPLTWTHYLQLVQFSDENVRKRWEMRILKEKLNSHQFRTLVDQQRHKERLIALPSTKRQPLQRGCPYLYRIIKSDNAHGYQKMLVVDCGFNFFIEIPPHVKVRFQSGDLVVSTKREKLYYLKHARQTREELYTYKAQICRVIDGDTLLVNIDCGFGIHLLERLRLRHIDAPEIKTFAGRQTQKFVQKKLAQVPFVVIKTYGSDKYDRYLVDVFVLKGSEDVREIAQKGELLNQRLLDEGLAARWKP